MLIDTDTSRTDAKRINHRLFIRTCPLSMCREMVLRRLNRRLRYVPITRADRTTADTDIIRGLLAMGHWRLRRIKELRGNLIGRGSLVDGVRWLWNDIANGSCRVVVVGFQVVR